VQPVAAFVALVEVERRVLSLVSEAMRTEAPYEKLRLLPFSIAYRMVSSVSEAEDIVQEAFVRIHRAEAGGERGAGGLAPGTVEPESWQADPRPESEPKMRKDVREFIRRLEAVGLTVEATPGHYRVLRKGKPLRKANGMPFTLPFSPDTIRWRRAAIVELRKLGIDL
jgi:Sigma-70 region 2